MQVHLIKDKKFKQLKKSLDLNLSPPTPMQGNKRRTPIIGEAGKRGGDTRGGGAETF